MPVTMLIQACRKHLTDARESYFEHMGFALTAGALAVGAGLACILHAFVPALCQETCSRTVALLQRLFADRGRLSEVREQSSGVTAFVGVLAVSLFTAAYVLVACSGALFAWAAASPAMALPLMYLAQNPSLGPLEPEPALLPSYTR